MEISKQLSLILTAGIDIEFSHEKITLMLMLLVNYQGTCILMNRGGW